MAIKLQTVGIIVKDMANTLHFYRTLGLAIPEGMDKEFNVDYEAPNGVTLGFLAEAAARQADPKFVTPVGQSMNLQFMVDSPAKVHNDYNQLLAAGYYSH
jgi:catechol 2,3-dioxygenase-like lactoylglutathione lyase family enzyme